MDGDDYRTLREELGWTQAQLAATLEVSREVVSRREKPTAIIKKEAELALRGLVMWQRWKKASKAEKAIG